MILLLVLEEYEKYELVLSQLRHIYTTTETKEWTVSTATRIKVLYYTNESLFMEIQYIQKLADGHFWRRNSFLKFPFQL